MPYKTKRDRQYPGCNQLSNRAYCLDNQKTMAYHITNIPDQHIIIGSTEISEK